MSDTARKIEGVLETFVLTLFYYLIWKACYRNTRGFHSYYGNGKFVLAGVYELLMLFLFMYSDGFKFGHLKLFDVTISQWISMVILNIITYFQLCLIANHMINPAPMLALTAIDMLLSGALVFAYTAWYHHASEPRRMAMVYGKDEAVTLKDKMDTRPDRYRITEMIPAEEPCEEICERIRGYDAVILNDIPAQLRNDLLKYCYQEGIGTYVVPKISDVILKGAEDISLFDTPLLLVRGTGLSLEERVVKRAMDLVICGIALIPASAVMAVCAAAIRLEDGGPVFYRQRRVTKDGKTFDILKFRSMVVDAEKAGVPQPATDNDPRITKTGRILRATRMDELPQILNILKGDMSIVGPRPERVEHVEKYTREIPEFAFRTKIKGGLTGYAQIYGKYNTSAYDKLRMDLMYIENYSIRTDIKLMLTTLRILLKKESTEGFEKAAETIKEEKLRTVGSEIEEKAV